MAPLLGSLASHRATLLMHAAPADGEALSLMGFPERWGMLPCPPTLIVVAKGNLEKFSISLISLYDPEESVKPVSFASKRSCALPHGSTTFPSPRSSGLFYAEALRRVFLAARFPAPWLSSRRSARLVPS